MLSSVLRTFTTTSGAQWQRLVGFSDLRHRIIFCSSAYGAYVLCNDTFGLAPGADGMLSGTNAPNIILTADIDGDIVHREWYVSQTTDSPMVVSFIEVVGCPCER